MSQSAFAEFPNLSPRLPPRYVPVGRLGRGGAGEVIEVRDRYTARRLALKLLGGGASEAERASLVHEAVALSGLEGLGVPRVLRFGRLEGGRLYLLRELVPGTSLQELVESKCSASRALGALAVCAEQLTRLHRAELLHGDVKPANIIVSEDGQATLVDLGLAAPFRESGTMPGGLTPRYAAPELLQGRPLTVRAEVYALGATLGDILEKATFDMADDQRAPLAAIRDRATMLEPLKRYPSADEFAAALRGAARLPPPAQPLSGLWPIVGFDNTSQRLMKATMGLADGQILHLAGPRESGRSVLLRRLAWSLGVEDVSTVWVDETLRDNASAVFLELSEAAVTPGTTFIVDDTDRIDERSRACLQKAIERGARLVVTSPEGLVSSRPLIAFTVPPLSDMTGLELVRRSIPSLTQPIATQILELAGRRPGPLKRLLERLATAPIVSQTDVEMFLEQSGASPESLPSLRPRSIAETDPGAALHDLLDRGRLTEAEALLAGHENERSLLFQVGRARLLVGLGEEPRAAELLRSCSPSAETAPEATRKLWQLWLGRAEIGAGHPEAAEQLLEQVAEPTSAVGLEAKVYLGLSLAHRSQSTRALEHFTSAARAAEGLGASRVEGLAHLCAGLSLAHEQRPDEALAAYERALKAAQLAGDANTLSTTQSNLAVLMRRRGDLARAIDHLEAAIDAGRRAGRRRAVHVALCNLANTELYLGRLERAQQSIEALEHDRSELGPREQAQLDGLQADLALLSGDVRGARVAYQRCALAYQRAGLPEPAGEARLEGLLLAGAQDTSSTEDLRRTLEVAREELRRAPTHQALLHLAQAHLADLQGDTTATRLELDTALKLARETQQREWIWRTLERRADLFGRCGQVLMAHRDREAALLVLEEIAAGLTPDLREVYWNEERRARLRAALRRGAAAASHTSTLPSDAFVSPLEQKLGRILQINAELLGEFDLSRLCSRIIEFALELLQAERGFVLTEQPDASLVVHTSRNTAGDDTRKEFSRSIARRAMSANRSVVSLNAANDASLRNYASVHQLMLQGVACIPIHGRAGTPIGALYLEGAGPKSQNFNTELPTLEAFAGQVGLALETARLLRENLDRAEELQRANDKLASAQERLQELLDDRTLRLKAARRKLRDAQDTLNAHFGYQGLVGVSGEMRKVYSLIDRVKDADIPVLIWGESGTGKEVVAKAIHRASDRGRLPFLGINCGAIPEHLLESELFGHVRGAFTGADRERKGLLREAGAGTVLLDEIGEMPHKMQAGLLRVLQERKVRPVGGVAEEAIECRFLFATHRDLKQLVDEGKFREDLYYRIMVVRLELPPLRRRTEDIAPLADYFLGLFAARYKRERKALTKSALQALSACPWPGNVRQLEHVLLNAWILCESDEIQLEDLELPITRGSVAAEVSTSFGQETPLPDTAQGNTPTRADHVEGEKAKMAKALADTNWNRVKAAELLGIPRRTFYRRLRQYGFQ